MVVGVTEFKTGMVIKWNNQMYQIQSYQTVKMQQRAPITRTRMINLKDGSVTEQAFRSNDKFEDVFLERREIQYLYDDGNLLHFMNTADYQDVVIARQMIGDKLKYLKDNTNVTGLYCDGELIAAELPASVVLKVTETDPGFRGDTAKSGTKPATVETGAVVKVPLFVDTGDDIKVDTRSGDYIERV